MKLYLSNLGRIKRAEIEPRGFTVFVGPNNTNKTWAAYAFYGIAKQLASSTAFIEHQHWSEFDFDFVSSLKISEGLFERTHEETRKVIKLLQQEPADATAVHVARKSLIPMDVTDTEEEVRIESAMLEEILALPSKSLSGAKARLLLNRDDLNSRVKADRISVQSEGSRVEAMLLAKSSSRNLASFGIALSDPEHDFEIIENRLVSMMRRLALGIFSNVHVFPAERKMLANLADRFSPWMLSSFHEKALNLAVRDYMNFLFRSELPSNLNNDLIKKNEYISALLEQEVLGGKVKIDRNRKQQLMRYLVGKDLDLPIHGASSLVRSLSGLDIYLRRGLAQENALLIIDEPEMNAHPDAQLAVCELLAILVNQGVQVLVTTHSPYFVDHLNNLIEASQLDESLKGAFAKKFKMQTKDAFLSPDQVAVYDFQEETSGQGDVTVKDIFDRENRLIDWGTFGKVTDYSSDLYSELIDKTLQQEIPHAAD